MSQMMVTTDFRLYHSNALDVLAGLLAETLRSPVPGQSLLVPDTILIPQAAMRRWLQATLATTHGVVANLEFLTPGEFVARALDANLGAVPNALDTAVLHWRLYAALRDPALLTQPELAELHAYLADGDLFKPWTLAEALSAAFENTRLGVATGCYAGRRAQIRTIHRPSYGGIVLTVPRTAHAASTTT